MNSKNITPINQDMCMCCLKEKALTPINNYA